MRTISAIRTQKTRPGRARAQRALLPMPEALYLPQREPDLVTVPARSALAIDGRGAPDAAAFQQSMGALYGVAYTLKFTRKKAGRGDFKIGPLEGRWWADLEGTAFIHAPRESWRWRLRIAVPADVTAAEVTRTIRDVTTKKGGKLAGSAAAARVTVERIPRQLVGRALHVGPYADEPRTFAQIDALLEREGVTPAFSHLEVYLGDPRRTAPEKLKTVLLRETRPA